MRRSIGSDDKPVPVGPAAYRVFTQRKIGFAIDFRFANGHRKSMSYADLVDAELNLALDGIILEGIGKRVTILGVNLEGLYELLLDHEVGEIVERHEPEHMMATVVGEGKTYVSELIWERL